uniref:Uncharacterized protein n=1 Tax=Erwinia amylovora ATCC BAA-2158 TaxID=889211 RepID=E5B4M1_ERWAM|nr:hypothetical protein predicted by Glimmer/Critica [Erwinia amylovora ATCC BAA-2158]
MDISIVKVVQINLLMQINKLQASFIIFKELKRNIIDCLS